MGTTDKVYQVSLSFPDGPSRPPIPPGQVTLTFGRGGVTLKAGVKGKEFSYLVAKAVYDKLVFEKTKKS